MDSKAGARLGDEYNDGTDLELSLGLSLSSADSMQKWQTAEASAPSFFSVDPAGESSGGTGITGLHSFAKHKTFNKPSGFNTAIKKFLERGLDYQEENGTFLDESNGFGLHTENKRLLVGSHEKSIQRLNIASPDAEGKDNPFHFKELQGSSLRARSRSQSPGHMIALQLVNAFNGNSNSGSPDTAEVVRGFHEDDTVHDESDQHKRLQDSHKKRKHLMDEQKHQKRGKNEDSPHGFCGLGSNPTVSTSNLNWENPSHALEVNNFRGLILHGSSQDKQDPTLGEKGYQTGGDESPGGEENICGNLVQNERKGLGDGGKFMSQLKASDITHRTVIGIENESTLHCSVPKKLSKVMTNVLNKESSLTRASTEPIDSKDGQTLVVGRDGGKRGSLMQRIRGNVASETSYVSIGGTEKVEEMSHGGQASSCVQEVAIDKVSSSTSILATPICSSLPASGSIQISYPVSSYPIVPGPYPVSVSMAHAHGMLFPPGVNIPYSMQYVPSGPEGSKQNMRHVGSTAFQRPGNEYPPHSSRLEMASWMLPFRPPAVSPLANVSNGVPHNRNTLGAMSEEANAEFPMTRMLDNGMGNSPSAADLSSVQNHPLLRPAVHSSANDHVPDVLVSSVPLFSTIPHLPSQLDVSNKGDVLGAGGPLSSSGNGIDEGRGSSSSLAKQQQMHAQNMIESSNLGQEEFLKALGSEFNQGSTENLLDGLDEDMAFLQYGMAPGLKFGGTGIAPKLPWVHTTGPDGRTIGGVLYRLSRTQLNVVCACHGKHMSPVEFAEHAGIVGVAGVEKNVGVKAYSSTNRAI